MDLTHEHEDAHETAQPAARPAEPSPVDAPADRIRGARDPRTLKPGPGAPRAPQRLSARGRPCRPATFAVSIGEGLTDDEIVDAFARLLLAVSRERPAIASASGASSPRAIGGTGA